MDPKSLQKLLNPNNDGGLGDVIRRAKAMGELASTLSTALPADLADGIVAANIRDSGELVVICASSAWAARLRFEGEQLMAAARESGAEVTSCTVSVAQSP
ncbi:MAG: DUF721 domain-containing protein [Woeseiaceae bacterium]